MDFLVSADTALGTSHLNAQSPGYISGGGLSVLDTLWFEGEYPFAR
jgi:hypothetical protein